METIGTLLSWILDSIIKPVNIKYISFKDGFSLVDLPVVEVDIQGNKYNFLIDSGASDSVIYNRIAKSITINDDELKMRSLKSCSGETQIVIQHDIDITINDDELKIEAYVVKSQEILYTDFATGYEIHGILGSRFLKEMSAIIDYKNEALFYVR